MSVVTSAKSLLAKVVALLAHEPVAVWGVVLAALVPVLVGVGVSAPVIAAIAAVASLLGIPVVRGKVTPVAALKAVIDGAKAEK